MDIDNLQWIVEFNINRGRQAEFERLVRDITDVARLSEPGTLKYEWFLDKKGNKCVVIESYDSSISGIAHVNGEAVKRVLPKILKIAKISRFDVFGNPSEELVKELADVSPGVYRFVGGFSRTKSL